MKRPGIVIGIVFMFVSLFAACGKGATSRALTSIEAVAKYLSAANGGASVDDPVLLGVKMDLQNLSAEGSGWKQLLGAIDTAGKYVALDLSGCTMPGTEFNPDPRFADGKKFIVSMILPDTAVNIADGEASRPTFRHFENLTNLPIGKSLTTIGNVAFYGCNLTSVTIPDGVTSIGSGAFASNQLTNVTIPNSVTFIGNQAFYENQLTSVTIPNSVTSIGKEVFYRCKLTSVTIPNSVTSIGSSAFSSNQLTSVTIPDSVTSIEDFAFYSNSHTLASVTIGANVTLSFNHSVEDGFEDAYNNGGKQAGTYTRPTNIWVWTKQ
jgi:hypothetical protein